MASKKVLAGIVVFGYFLWHQRKYWQELWSLVTFFGIKESNGMRLTAGQKQRNPINTA
ncbi:MAG: hypothetical protein U5L01_05240 [Rheinheimera sp.]|nr:hypothetical protein [Rheinheimera sp.]